MGGVIIEGVRRRCEVMDVYMLRRVMKAVDKIDKKVTLGYLELLIKISNFIIQVNYDGHHKC